MSRRFVLASPPWLQYGVLSLALVASASAIAWVARFHLDEAMTAGLTLLGGVALLVLALVANPKLWRRWIHAVADAKGLWLPTRRGRMICVPWEQVGQLRPGSVTLRLPWLGRVDAYLQIEDALFEQLSWRRDVPGGSPPAGGLSPGSARRGGP